MKLIPDDVAENLQRGLVTAIWGIGTLLLGTLVIAILGILFDVSGSTSLGMWGAVMVMVLTGIVALIAWRRYGQISGGWKRNEADKIQAKSKLVEIQPPAERSMRPSMQIPSPASTLGSGMSIKATRDSGGLRPNGVSEYKLRFYAELEAGNFDTAEQIVSEMEALPDESQWCANARRRLSYERARR
jgi:hypothetical protein